MSKEKNRIITFLNVSLSIVMVGGSLWLLGTFLGEAIWFLAKRSSQTTTTEIGKIENSRDLIRLNLVGNSSFSGYALLRHPEFKKLLGREYGMALNYQEYDLNKKINLLEQGQADIWVTTLDRYLKENPQGKIVGAIARSVGADAIVLNNKKYPNLRSIEELNNLLESERDRGNQIGLTYTSNTTSEYFTLVVSNGFEQFHLDKFTTQPRQKATETWQLLTDPQANIAVGVMSEPYVTLAAQEGYPVILSSRDTPTSIVHIIVASDRTLRANPETVIQFLEAYYTQIDRNVLQPVKIKEYIASESKLSLEQAEKILTGIDFFTATEAKEWIENDLKKSIDSTAAKLVATGKIKTIPENIDRLISSKQIQAAAGNNAMLIAQLKQENPELANRLAGKGNTIAVEERAREQEEDKSVLREAKKFASEAKRSEKDRYLEEFKTTKVGNLKWNGKINFEFASAQLSEESSHVLQHVAEKISELNPQTVAIRVIGHTSQVGTVRANQIISQQRAQVVVDALRDRGLQHKFIAEGKGFSQPLPNYSPDHYNQQRTEIVIERIYK